MFAKPVQRGALLSNFSLAVGLKTGRLLAWFCVQRHGNLGILLLVYLNLSNVLFVLLFLSFLFFLNCKFFFKLLLKELIGGSLPFCCGPRMFLSSVVKTNGCDLVNAKLYPHTLRGHCYPPQLSPPISFFFNQEILHSLSFQSKDKLKNYNTCLCYVVFGV